MIIDSHIHFDFKVKNKEQAIDGLLHEFELVGVNKSCIMPFIGNIGNGLEYFYASKEDITKCTDEACVILEKYPGKFYHMVYMNSILPIDFLKAFVKKYILEGPVTGIKLTIQMKASDPRLEPFLSLLEENDIPLLFHCWYKTVQKYRYESDPKDIVCMAEKFPSLRVLVAHVTGCRFRGAQDIRKYPNLLIDTSGSQPEDGFIEYALNNLGPDRVLFGSDYPGRDIATQLARVYSINMDPNVREKVLYKNAIKFFEGGR